MNSFNSQLCDPKNNYLDNSQEKFFSKMPNKILPLQTKYKENSKIYKLNSFKNKDKNKSLAKWESVKRFNTRTHKEEKLNFSNSSKRFDLSGNQSQNSSILQEIQNNKYLKPLLKNDQIREKLFYCKFPKKKAPPPITTYDIQFEEFYPKKYENELNKTFSNFQCKIDDNDFENSKNIKDKEKYNNEITNYFDNESMNNKFYSNYGQNNNFYIKKQIITKNRSSKNIFNEIDIKKLPFILLFERFNKKEKYGKFFTILENVIFNYLINDFKCFLYKLKNIVQQKKNEEYNKINFFKKINNISSYQNSSRKISVKINNNNLIKNTNKIDKYNYYTQNTSEITNHENIPYDRSYNELHDLKYPISSTKLKNILITPHFSPTNKYMNKTKLCQSKINNKIFAYNDIHNDQYYNNYNNKYNNNYYNTNNFKYHHNPTATNSNVKKKLKVIYVKKTKVGSLSPYRDCQVICSNDKLNNKNIINSSKIENRSTRIFSGNNIILDKPVQITYSGKNNNSSNRVDTKINPLIINDKCNYKKIIKKQNNPSRVSSFREITSLSSKLFKNQSKKIIKVNKYKLMMNFNYYVFNGKKNNTNNSYKMLSISKIEDIELLSQKRGKKICTANTCFYRELINFKNRNKNLIVRNKTINDKTQINFTQSTLNSENINKTAIQNLDKIFINCFKLLYKLLQKIYLQKSFDKIKNFVDSKKENNEIERINNELLERKCKIEKNEILLSLKMKLNKNKNSKTNSFRSTNFDQFTNLNKKELKNIKEIEFKNKEIDDNFTYLFNKYFKGQIFLNVSFKECKFNNFNIFNKLVVSELIISNCGLKVKDLKNILIADIHELNKLDLSHNNLGENLNSLANIINELIGGKYKLKILDLRNNGIDENMFLEKVPGLLNSVQNIIL